MRFFWVIVLLHQFLSHAQASSEEVFIDQNYTTPQPIDNSWLHLKLAAQPTAFRGHITINRSNVILDCQGRILQGKQQQPSIQINSSSNKPIENITIKDCHFSQHQNTAIHIQNNTAQSTGIHPQYSQQRIQNINSRIAKICKLPPHTERAQLRQCIREHSPKEINIINNHFENNQIAIYIAPYIQGVRLLNNHFIGNTIAIHLSHDSHATLIQSNYFTHNGRRLPPSTAKTYREAIAIDGSSDNQISGNTFINNYGVAIRTYKNCGEHQSKTREEGANHNIIERNLFELSRDFAEEHSTSQMERAFFAVSIASRQSLNSAQWACSDGYVYEHKTLKIANDQSTHNTISNNQFKHYRYAVRIQDSVNTLKNNTFSTPSTIILGSPFKIISQVDLQSLQDRNLTVQPICHAKIMVNQKMLTAATCNLPQHDAKRLEGNRR